MADKLTAALHTIGLVPFGVEGDPFDPSLHEAVQHEGDGSNPVIGTVMRQGYRLGDGRCFGTRWSASSIRSRHARGFGPG